MERGVEDAAAEGLADAPGVLELFGTYESISKSSISDLLAIVGIGL